MCVCVCVFSSYKSPGSPAGFCSTFCASLALLVQSTCANSFKQTSQNNSLSLLVPLPIAPSPTCWPTFLQSLFLSLLISISAPTYTPLSVSPPRILSPSFSSAFVSGLLIVISFIFSHPSPLSSYFPQSLWCVVGKADILCGGNEAHWRPGMSPAPLHTHTREVPLRPEGHMKEVTEHQDDTRRSMAP